jgi:hypothetical protein
MLGRYLKIPSLNPTGKPIRGYCSCCSFPVVKVSPMYAVETQASARYHKVFDSQRELLDLCPICRKRLDKTFKAEMGNQRAGGHWGIQIRFQQT